MPALDLDEQIQAPISAHRRAINEDRLEEVWEGASFVPPLPNNEHQEIVGDLSFTFCSALGRDLGVKVRPGVNISDRDQDRVQNQRCPDEVVFLPGTTAENRGSHWLGGPDFAVEMISEGDRSREKRRFYAKVNVSELLIVDRFPWAIELYRLQDGLIGLVEKSMTEAPEILNSDVLGLSFRLVAGGDRPRIELKSADDRIWLA